jgi:hypothetical protein
VDVPVARSHLFYIAIGPDSDYVFGFAINSNLEYINTRGDRQAPLNVWTHIAFTQQVGSRGVIRRVLYLDGGESISYNAQNTIYNPTPGQVGATSTDALRA